MLLKEISSISSGQGAPQSKEDYCESGITFIKASDLDAIIEDQNEDRASKITDEAFKKNKLCLFPKDTILFAKSGMSCLKNRVYVLKEASCVVNHLCCVSNVDERYNVNWIALFMKHYNVTRFIKDNAYPSISLKDVGSIVLPTIDKSLQNKIVESISIIQKAIDLKRKQLEDLDELVKSKFQEMFGDVDGYKCLRDYSSLITKGASPRWQGLTYQDSGVLFITSENVREGYLDISKAKYLDDGINKLLPRSILQKGDILINIVGASIGRAAIFDIDQLANINQAVAVVRPIENGIDIHFLIEYLNSQRAMELYDSMKQGGARDNLSLKNIADLLIPDVSAFKQKEFSSLVRKRNELKEIVVKEIAYLEELMDSKMDEYFG